MNLILEIIVFLLIFSLIYILGKGIVILLKLKFEFFEDGFYSTTLGILLFTFIAFIFSFLKISNLLLPFLILVTLINLFKIRNNLPSFSSLNLHKKPLIGVGIMSVIFSGIMLITGQWGNSIIYRHDDTWHLALINELKVNFPPQNPGFAGIPLEGYHFFYDFFAAILSNIFKISPSALHFHIIPLIFALLFGLGIYSLMYKWQKNQMTSLIAVFLCMFGGSFAFIISLFIKSTISFDNGLGMLQPALTLYNPPLAISLIILLFALYSLFRNISERENKWLVPLIFAIGMLPMFKIYAAILLIVGYIVFVILSALRKRFFPIIIGLVSAVIVLITFGVFSGKSASIIFYPLWGPHALLQNLNYYDFTKINNTPHGISSIFQRSFIEILGLILFVLGNLGTRLIGLLGLRKKNLKDNFDFTIILGAMFIVSLILPLFFIQSLKEFEIIQFSSYYLFIASLFASIGLVNIFRRFVNWHIIAVIFILLTLPSAYSQYVLLPELINSRIHMDSPSMQAYKFLSLHGDFNDTVLELPSRDALITDPDLKDWYSKSTPTIIAFGNKRGFLNNEFIEFPNVDLDSRKEIVKQVLNTQTKSEERIFATENVLRKNRIKYIYMPSGDISELLKSKYIHKIFDNQKIVIYQVDI